MPLDLDRESPLYRLGCALALAEGILPDAAADALAIDAMLARPAAGFALLQQRIAAVPRSRVADDISRLLAGNDLPDAIGADQTGPFWIGYYHQRRGERVKLSPDQLRTAGEALYGTQWQTEMSRGLDIAARRVKKWLERSSVPAWASAEVYALLMIKNRKAAAAAAVLLAATGRESGEHQDRNAD